MDFPCLCFSVMDSLPETGPGYLRSCDSKLDSLKMNALFSELGTMLPTVHTKIDGGTSPFLPSSLDSIW